MILVDIQVPSINQIYDFELDEEMPVGELIRSVSEIIAEKENMDYCREDEMKLYDLEHEKILNEVYSLEKQGIRSGEKLVLI